MWLGYRLSQTGICPGESKFAGLLTLKRPNTLKKLHGFLGSSHKLNKFIANHAPCFAPFHDIVKKDKRFQWNSIHDSAFAQLKTAVHQASENAHFDPHALIRVNCDASLSGFCAVFEQHCSNGWNPMFLESRSLNDSESRYSTNVLQLFAVAWSVEQFRDFLYDRFFLVRTDHRTLLSALKFNLSKKSTLSRSARWRSTRSTVKLTAFFHLKSRSFFFRATTWHGPILCSFNHLVARLPFPPTIKTFPLWYNHTFWRQF